MRPARFWTVVALLTTALLVPFLVLVATAPMESGFSTTQQCTGPAGGPSVCSVTLPDGRTADYTCQGEECESAYRRIVDENTPWPMRAMRRVASLLVLGFYPIEVALVGGALVIVAYELGWARRRTVPPV